MLGAAQVAAMEEMTTMRPPLGMTGAIDLTSDAGARTLIAIVLFIQSQHTMTTRTRNDLPVEKLCVKLKCVVFFVDAGV
jgi:hypothetical protein